MPRWAHGIGIAACLFALMQVPTPGLNQSVLDSYYSSQFVTLISPLYSGGISAVPLAALPIALLVLVLARKPLHGWPLRFAVIGLTALLAVSGGGSMLQMSVSGEAVATPGATFWVLYVGGAVLSAVVLLALIAWANVKDVANGLLFVGGLASVPTVWNGLVQGLRLLQFGEVTLAGLPLLWAPSTVSFAVIVLGVWWMGLGPHARLGVYTLRERDIVPFALFLPAAAMWVASLRWSAYAMWTEHWPWPTEIVVRALLQLPATWWSNGLIQLLGWSPPVWFPGLLAALVITWVWTADGEPTPWSRTRTVWAWAIGLTVAPVALISGFYPFYVLWSLYTFLQRAPY